MSLASKRVLQNFMDELQQSVTELRSEWTSCYDFEPIMGDVSLHASLKSDGKVCSLVICSIKIKEPELEIYIDERTELPPKSN